MYKMQFQGRLVIKFSCASGANNQPFQFSRMDARCIIATSETILNIVKNFVRKLFQAIRKFFISTPPIHQRFATALLSALQALKNNKPRAVNSRVYSIVLKCLETLVKHEPRVYEITSQSFIV